MEQLSHNLLDDTEPRLKLSICISTLNRADFLGANLDAILPQLTPDTELLVVDNASSDHTPTVIAARQHYSSQLRYIRRETNLGVDRNYDRAVELAHGDYCWLMSDDDLVKPGAVKAILDVLRQNPGAALVNYEFRDFSMSNLLQERALDFSFDRVYGPWELDRMFVELGDFVRYIGASVMRRETWLSRRRDMYIGSLYAFVGMLYQEKFSQPVHVIAEPYVSYRMPQIKRPSQRMMELVLVQWPSLVASLPISDSSKRTLHSAFPWKHPFELLNWRGNGCYSYDTYRRWLRPQLYLIRDKSISLACALVPISLANAILLLFYSVRRKRLRQMEGLKLALLKGNATYLKGCRQLKRQQDTLTPSRSYWS